LKIDHQSALDELQSKLDLLSVEHGDVYIDGVAPTFDKVKARFYDSFWNWVRQDVFDFFSKLKRGEANGLSRDFLYSICNRVEGQNVSEIVNYLHSVCDADSSIQKIFSEISSNIATHASLPPVYKLGTSF
jgi:fatty acid synthase subunit beta